MIIKVKPSDLIKRFVWDKYEHFCLDDKSNAEISKIIKDDLEFEISEEDAFVIGLTNVIYTDEVIYKFKQYLREVLDNKNFEIDNKLFINREILINSISDFKNKIPKNWSSDDFSFNTQLNELPKIYQVFIENTNKLVTIDVQDWPCVKYAQVKKIINKI